MRQDTLLFREGPRTWPLGVSLQNAAQGPMSTWGDEVGPRVPPTEPWSCVLPAGVSGTERNNNVADQPRRAVWQIEL